MSPPISTRSALAEALRGFPPPLLEPAGPYAYAITSLSWFLLAGGAAVFVVVMAALWVALRGPPALKARLGGESMIWVGGIAVPLVVLSALLVYGLTLTRALSSPIADSDLRVRVTGAMWWWAVEYLDPQGRALFRDANELHIPVGRTVVIELDSADVIHSFWVPRLSGKVDMIPGRRNLMRIAADKPGVYGGQCAEYCGGPHALMGFVVVAHRAADFDAWRAARAAGIARTVSGAAAQRGAALFLTAGCAACHRIGGTAANGVAGPDLTHIGARTTLGAGIIANNRGTMIGWIADSQAIKPGNRMPPYPTLSAAELADLAAYLDALK